MAPLAAMVAVSTSSAQSDKPLLHVCYAPADHAWVHGRMVRELGLQAGQYRTRADDGLGELQLAAIERTVDECRFTVLVASTAARWNKLAQFAAALAQHRGLEDQVPRLIIVARDFVLDADATHTQLSRGQRALVGLDCSDENRTVESMARLRTLLALEPPVEEPPACPYPGLARFTAANRDLLFGRDGDRDALLQRIRAGHTRILVVGPSGTGKSSLVHAAVLPELAPEGYLTQVVPRGGDLAAALRTIIDALEVPDLGAAFDAYLAAVAADMVTDAQIEAARARLRAVPMPDPRRRVVVVDPLEEIFAEDDVAPRAQLFHLLGGLWSLPWCTVILCMRADFYGAVMVERCWRELESCQYPVASLDEVGLRAAIAEPARRAGVHVDAALVERLIREVDRDRSSSALPLLQVALKELWTHLRWRYLTLADYERIVSHDQRGLAAVLAVHAEAVLQPLTGPGDRAIAQRILLDLVHLGEGRPHTRRRRTLSELRRSGDAREHLQRVLEALIAGRLVTTGDGEGSAPRRDELPADADHDTRGGRETELLAEGGERHFDLAHDTLITGWPALAIWLAEHRDQLRTQRQLEARARAGHLLTSDELPEFTRWIAWTATPAGQALGASEALRTLVRRSVAARRFRRRLFGAGLVAVTAIAVVFAFLFLQLREEKTKTQASIREAVKVANQNVFELEGKLRTVGCAEAAQVRDGLLRRANELLAELSKLSPLGEDEQRTGMATKVAQGDFARERGRLGEAEKLYREALTGAQRRAAQNPSNTAWQHDLLMSYERLGDVAVSAGKLDDARGFFDQALAVAKALVAQDPSNTTWQRDLSVAYERLGDVAVSAGKLDDARGFFDQALAVATALVARDLSNNDWQRDLSVAYERLGDVAVSTGKLDDARAFFDQALAVRKALAAKDPSNTTWQRDLSVAYERLGSVAVSAGKLDDARAFFDQALAVRKALAAKDPSNTTWQRDLSVAYNKLGDVAVSAGKLDDACAFFNQALAVRKVLAAKDPSNTTWQRDLSVAYERLGSVAVSAGKLDDGRAFLDQDLAVAKALAAKDPSNTDWQRDLSVAYEQLGNVAVSAGKLDDARAFFDQALAVRKALAAQDPSKPVLQLELCRSLAQRSQVSLAAHLPKEATRYLDDARAIYRRLQQADLFQHDVGFAQTGKALNQLAAIVAAASKR